MNTVISGTIQDSIGKLDCSPTINILTYTYITKTHNLTQKITGATVQPPLPI